MSSSFTLLDICLSPRLSVVLDLGDYSEREVESLQWISGLSQLQHLDMSGANLSKASDWLRVTNTRPSLVENLHMSGCGLYHIPGGIANMTNLKFLYLDLNSISSIPKWLYRLSHLQSLILSFNFFHGEISSSLGNLTSIVNLDISWNYLNGSVSEIFESFSRRTSGQIESLNLFGNNLSGQLTDKLDNFEKLRDLDLSNNSISGPLPPSFGNLSCLEYLSIGDNNLTGVVSQLHFTNLTRLVEFDARGNSLTLETTPHWLPPFQLEMLILDYWHLEPSELPMWLQSQTQLRVLSMPNTRISGTIPTWLWNFSSQLEYIDLSENKLYGEVRIFRSSPFSEIFLGSNQFNGSLPLVSSTVGLLDLSNSSFSGTLFHFFCNNNSEPKALSFLHLGNNLLSGKIPECLRNWKKLSAVNLDSNNLIGNIPRSLGYLHSLQYLHLRKNHLHGELPPYLKKCTYLTILDLSYNKFLGKIPMWIGTSLSNLRVLSLRSNQFHGHIPYKLCDLTYLQILDLAHNNLSGRMPRCLHNFTAMTISSENTLPIDSLRENANVVTKGREVKYGSSLLSLAIILDLSDNIISGEIPEELSSLICLQSVNLSYNLLSGRIPPKIGDMRRLESLDLSRNQLCGQIAPSMSRLTFLSALNLSYNNLTGEIPKSTQLQSLDQSSFIGNKLCGPPLEVNCSNTNGTVPPVADQKHGGSDLLEDGWFYLSLGLGFLFGFWSVLGSLLLNLPWSIVFNRFLNSIVKKLYGVIVEHF
ncbi:PREDICTED: LRR receptor-like serine/threonine-protein kinase FLS2 isoform X2 [Prunus mume]|uniref:LRR receptor-like serine/threonine-protein kinase FLS2 isoform X2 n=1 Tax=Prunus mume TaxID=102107 RepID=A0ABM1LJG2_PRUMU|nr:PREDICTED: LRR receptor-like serine/threonine-protein kinase FLS2 isoform X2 [Prunus mume]